MTTKINMSGSHVGAKALCAVTDSTTMEVLPLIATDNGDGTAKLKIDASVTVDSIDIGDVDILEFPAGNLGQRGKAASLSVAPATDITDATYIGDVKFGESLPAGTNNIGDVDVLSIIPGTANTNLGKAIDSTVGATDTGVAVLGKYELQSVVTSISDGDYDIISLTDLRELRVRDQRHREIESCNAITGWVAVNDDAANVALSLNHVLGTGAISFDKANGASNTVYAIIGKTITGVNLSKLFSAGGFVGMAMYLSSLTNVVSVFLRLGTSASHYNQWKWPVAQLTAASWMNLRAPVTTPDYSGNLGNGWDSTAITYVAVGVEFAGETNTLTGILVDHIHAVGGRVTSSTEAATTPEITVVPNVNIQRVANSPTGVAGNGVVGNGTQRVTIASDSTGQIGTTKPKGTVTTAHNAIAETATSSEISCVGFNSLLMYVGPFSDAQNWTFKIQGCLTTGGTFVDWYELANTGSMAAMSYQCNAARGFTFKGIPDYIKVVATRDGTASTVTVKVQPFNV